MIWQQVDASVYFKNCGIAGMEVSREGGRWQAIVRFPAGWLPCGLRAANAYAIHGLGPARRFLAASPVPGDEPDFHQLASFPALPPGGGAGTRDGSSLGRI